jgi:hypothetical protein
MKYKWILVIIFIAASIVYAQDDGQAPTFMSIPQIGNISAGNPVRFDIVVTDMSPIESVRLYYKTADDKGFTSVEMEKDVNYSAEIPGFEVVEGVLEYYFWAKDIHNNQAFYPERGDKSPMKIKVGKFESKIDNSRFSIQMLYPEPNIATDDEKPTFVFLLHDPDNLVSTKKLRIVLNNRDISEKLNLDGSLITYLPDKVLDAGPMNINIRLEEKDGSPLFMTQYPINIGKIPAGREAGMAKDSRLGKLRVNANVGLDSDYDIFFGKDQPENRPLDVHKASARLRMRYGKIQLNTSALLNAHIFDENARELSERRQPLNRLRVDFRSPILDLTIGDASPEFSELTLKGTRVRGLSAWMKLGWWNTAYVHGTTRQTISPIVSTHPDSTHWQMLRNLSGDTLYIDHVKGTPEKLFRGLSTSMDFFEHFKMGISAFKSYDDISSLNLPYTPLEDNYQFIANSVVGLNAELHFNQDRTVLSAELALSATNDLKADDSLLIHEGGLDSTLLVDINEFLGYPLTDDIFLGSAQGMGLSIPFPNLDDFDPLSFVTDNVIGKGTYRLAFRTPMNLKWMQMDVNSEYFRIPANFVSIGNPSLQTDIMGLRSGVRLRFLKNQLSFTARYENTFDNVAGNTKTQTTNTESVVGGVGLNFFGLPMLNYSIRVMNRLGEPAKGFETVDELTLNNNKTITHTLSPTYQFTLLNTQYNLNASLMLMDYKDENSDESNYLTQSLTTALTAGLQIPLTITLGGGYSLTEPNDPEQGNTLFIIHSSRIAYKWMKNRLNTYIGYSMVDGSRDDPETNEPVLDNSKFTFKAGAGYKIMNNLTADANMDLISVTDRIDPDKEYDEFRFRIRLKYWF